MNFIMEDIEEEEGKGNDHDDSILIEDLNDGEDEEGPKQFNATENDGLSLRMSREVRMSKEFKIGAADQYKKMKV